MSEPTPAAEQPQEDVKAIPAAVQLQNDVKTEVASLDAKGAETSVRSSVIKSLAGEEVRRRVSVLSLALTKRKDAESAVKKIKPTHVTATDQTTGVESKAFTKKEIEERNKLQKKLDKLDAAIGAVIETPSAATYGKLTDLTK